MRSKPTTRLWLGLWGLLALLLVVRAASRPDGRGVILDHVEFGRRLIHGEDLYAPWSTRQDRPTKALHPPYPPSFGLLTAPFALLHDGLGMRAVRIAWSLLQLASVAAIALMLRHIVATRMEPPPSPLARAPERRWHWLWLGTALLGMRFLLRDTHGGGGNLVNLALCLGAFVVAARRPALAGLLLGFSLATKPTQLWLLPVLWLFGNRRAVGWTLLAFGGFALLTLALQRFDLSALARWIEGSWRFSTSGDAFAVPAFDFPAFEWMNQSLRCALARWFGDVPPEYAARVQWGLTPGFGWSTPNVAWLTRAVSMLLLGSLLVVAHRTRHSAAARCWTFAGALVLSVLLSPLSWKAHHVALLPLLFLLLQQQRRSVFVLLAAWAVCCLPGQELVGDDGDEWFNSTYIVSVWDLVLFAVALRRALVSGAAER